MERLTVRNSEGIGVLKQPFECERCGDFQWSLPDLGNGSPTDRLAEYEDLEEQCIRDNTWGLRILLTKWKEFFRDIQELYEYRKLEKQGKLLKLPVAIGDKIFFIFMGCPKDYKEEYCRDHEGSCENCHHRVPEIVSRDFRISDILNMDNIFATREEAEAALKGLERGKGE